MNPHLDSFPISSNFSINCCSIWACKASDVRRRMYTALCAIMVPKTKNRFRFNQTAALLLQLMFLHILCWHTVIVTWQWAAMPWSKHTGVPCSYQLNSSNATFHLKAPADGIHKLQLGWQLLAAGYVFGIWSCHWLYGHLRRAQCKVNDCKWSNQT